VEEQLNLSFALKGQETFLTRLDVQLLQIYYRFF